MRIWFFGFVLGILAAFIGLFAGLQVSATLGTILLFPVIAVAAMTDTPIGAMSPPLFVAAVLVQGCVWALAAYAGSRVLRRRAG